MINLIDFVTESGYPRYIFTENTEFNTYCLSNLFPIDIMDKDEGYYIINNTLFKLSITPFKRKPTEIDIKNLADYNTNHLNYSICSNIFNSNLENNIKNWMTLYILYYRWKIYDKKLNNAELTLGVITSLTALITYITDNEYGRYSYLPLVRNHIYELKKIITLERIHL